MKTMKKVLISLLLILCLVLVGCGVSNSTPEVTTTPITEFSETSTTPTTESSETNTTEEIPETSETVEETTIESEILSFVDTFNGDSAVQLMFAEDFTPSDKASSHYRTEFRLSAYSDAIGKSYKYDEAVVDIVGKQDWSGDITIRVYMDGATLEQCAEMVKYASPIMDPDIDTADVQKTIDYINENKTANGYYYADLGLLLLGNDTKGYEFMLKMSND